IPTTEIHRLTLSRAASATLASAAAHAAGLHHDAGEVRQAGPRRSTVFSDAGSQSSPDGDSRAWARWRRRTRRRTIAVDAARDLDKEAHDLAPRVRPLQVVSQHPAHTRSMTRTPIPSRSPP